MSLPVFARHETFPVRYGWLKKGVEYSPHWNSQKAHHDLGMGKNMAQSLRYWLQAFGLVEPSAPDKLTSLAEKFFSEKKGFDPYVEDRGTLWWLHYHLVKGGMATTWEFALCHFPRVRFTKWELLAGLKEYVKEKYPNFKVAESSLEKDVTVFLRMYLPPKQNKYTEDSINSPFCQLGLLEQDGDNYAFKIGYKPGLPVKIILAAIFDFAAEKSSKSLSFSELVQNKKSPFWIFRLSEAYLYEALEKAIEDFSELQIRDTAGIKQLIWTKEANKLRDTVLRSYYHALP